MKKVVLYTKPTCPFYIKAIALLDELGVTYEDIDVTDKPELRREIIEKYNHSTVPVIIIGDEFIGGSDTLIALHESGELQKKLAE